VPRIAHARTTIGSITRLRSGSLWGSIRGNIAMPRVDFRFS
jgi:hypothetical protein